MVAAEAGSAETVQLLLDSGADVSARDKHGMTALMLAFDDRETVETLLRNGADYKARDQEDMTALMHSLRESASEKLNVLIANGAGSESIEAARTIMTTAPDVDWLPRDFGKKEGYRILSEIYLKLGMKQEAVESCKQAIQENPKNLEAYRVLSDAYVKLNLTKEAVETSQQAVRLSPDDPIAYFNLGVTYLAVGDKESAMAQYQRLLKMVASVKMEAPKKFGDSELDAATERLNESTFKMKKGHIEMYARWLLDKVNGQR